MDTLTKTLQQYWGYTQFRDPQAQAISTILDQKDTLLLMPTGSGKSLCFQLPILVQQGIALVISPLIALMEDQVTQLKARKIPAAAIHSSLTSRDIMNILDLAQAGRIKLLYLSPERLQSTVCQERLPHLPIRYVAIDEAHCISEWGYDFRPAYLQLDYLKNHMPNVPIMALTATAPPMVVKDILNKLHIPQATIYQKSYLRPEISYVLRHSSNKFLSLTHILQRIEGSIIIYLNKRVGAQQLADRLTASGFSAIAYHAGLAPSQRQKRQKLWMDDAKRIIIATNAFGMGINKLNVRAVIHMEMPLSLEAYYQEAGRAGRDKKRAYAIALYNNDDIPNLKRRLDHEILPLDTLKHIYQLLSNYFQIAVGSYNRAAYALDVEDFTRHYDIPLAHLSLALRQLQDEGLIQYEDYHNKPANIELLLTPREFYSFRLSHTTHAETVEALVTYYGDRLTQGPQSISLHLLQRKNHLSIKKIHADLASLARLGVLRYTPKSHLPQLTFLTPRYAADKLPLSRKKHQERVGVRQKKLAALIDYLTHTQSCRSTLLVAYFGEKNAPPCGVCDICLAKKREKKKKTHYHDDILAAVAKGAFTPQELLNTLKHRDSQALLKALRQLVEKGALYYDEYGRLTKEKKRP